MTDDKDLLKNAAPAGEQTRHPMAAERDGVPTDPPQSALKTFRMTVTDISPMPKVLTTWFVSNGTKVREGDILVEISTDKVESELPSPATGQLEILVQPNSPVETGQVIALIHEKEAEVLYNQREKAAFRRQVLSVYSSLVSEVALSEVIAAS